MDLLDGWQSPKMVAYGGEKFGIMSGVLREWGTGTESETVNARTKTEKLLRDVLLELSERAPHPIAAYCHQAGGDAAVVAECMPGGRMILYHGSAVENFVPTFGLGKEKHDYGKGFYLTESIELAREWSVAASPFVGGWVHAYEIDLAGLNVFDFTTLSPLAWLAELMKHREGDSGRYYRENAPRFIARYGVDISGYDVVRGWRADASYFFICKSFVRNNIGVDFLGELLSLGNFGIQYFVQSEKAFSALRQLDEKKESVQAAIYYDHYNQRDAAARSKMYDLIENDPRNKLDKTFKDIV